MEAKPVGRPPKFKSVEDMQRQIDDYFAMVESKTIIVDGVPRYEPVTYTGLCLHLDTTRETLDDYAIKPEFSDSIRKAKMRVENYAERMLHIGKNQTGAIFALKNFGWRDQQDINHGGQGADKPIYTESAIMLTPDEAYKKLLG